jgi:hypothetical protein
MPKQITITKQLFTEAFHKWNVDGCNTETSSIEDHIKWSKNNDEANEEAETLWNFLSNQ